MYQLYEDMRDAVAEVLDPSKLAYVVLLHFEGDENGGMDRFIEGATARVRRLQRCARCST